MQPTVEGLIPVLSRRLYRPALLAAGLLAVAACSQEDESVLSDVPDEPPEPDREFACEQAATFVLAVQEFPDAVGTDPTSEDVIRARNAVIDAWRQLDNALTEVPDVANEGMEAEDEAGVVGEGDDDSDIVPSWAQMEEALDQLDEEDEFPAAVAAVEAEAEAVLVDMEQVVDDLECA